ncbi:hypothetical protein SMALA_4729 [Streptomyces malaysiensis subsp. malaysiensis]|nr:hypothetical protein SMALA_4729 [Streptomyces malaysiensis]
MGLCPGPCFGRALAGGQGRELRAGGRGSRPRTLAGALPQALLRWCPGRGQGSEPRNGGREPCQGSVPENPRWGAAPTPRRGCAPGSVLAVVRLGVGARSRGPGASSGRGVQSLGVKLPEPGWGGGVPPSVPSALGSGGSGDVPLSSPSGV